MKPRDQVIEEFLLKNGFGQARLVKTIGDASGRRYFRYGLNGKTIIIMDAPAPYEEIGEFQWKAEMFRSYGWRVPAIHAGDQALGLLMLEDFGDQSFTHQLQQGAKLGDLFMLATEALIHLHRQPNEAAKKLPPYDDVRLACEALWATEWYVPLVLPKPLGLTIREEYIDLWVKTFPLARIAGEHAIHRDFHVDNLMLLPKETGIARCGMLDFQDAVYGSIAYDLVSLLQDARLDVPEDVVEACLQKYLSSLPKSKHEDFMMAYAILGAQRAAKILGNFTRLKVRDDKGYLLCHIPRVWGYIERNVKHPALKDIKEWFDFHVPPEYRGLKGRLAA